MLNITWTPCLTFELKKVCIQQFFKYCHVIQNNEKALKPASDSTRRPPVYDGDVREQSADGCDRLICFQNFISSVVRSHQDPSECSPCSTLIGVSRSALCGSVVVYCWPGCDLCWWIKNTNVHFNVWFHTNASYRENIHLEIILNISILIVDCTSHWSINKLLFLRHTSLPCVCSVQGGIAGPQHRAF